VQVHRSSGRCKLASCRVQSYFVLKASVQKVHWKIRWPVFGFDRGTLGRFLLLRRCFVIELVSDKIPCESLEPVSLARTEEVSDCRDEARPLRWDFAALSVSARAAAISSIETCSNSGGELRQRSREVIVLKSYDMLVFELREDPGLVLRRVFVNQFDICLSDNPVSSSS
jgi:hypothetical protein